MSNKTKKSFNCRAFVSVLAGFSFVLMAVTGLVLFFTPSCRVARDTSWIFWGRNKDQWVAVHVWFSIAFVVASLIHIYLNWTALISYFKTKLQQRFAFWAEWISVLVICSIFYVGTVREVVVHPKNPVRLVIAGLTQTRHMPPIALSWCHEYYT